jgi:undecaprenyl-diphosphatase
VVHDLAQARTHTLDRLTGWGTLPADPLPVAIVWFGAVIVTAVRTKHWRAPSTIMLAVGGEKLSYLLTTLIVRRPRPDVPTIGTRHATSSFPSGHVGSAISLWGSLAFLIVVGLTSRSTRAKVLAVIPVAILAIDVALCRMYRGHHYPTDVVVGAAIGVVWIVFATRIVDRLDTTHRGADATWRTTSTDSPRAR